MPPNDRSPYIIAYPAVILSAWLWEAAGSIATAAIAGLLIEHFMFSTQKIPLGPAVAGSSFRVAAFVLGSILAGVLTRRAAMDRERQARLAGERQLALSKAEQQILAEQERSRDLAREDELRTKLALEGADLGIWEWDLRTNKSRWSQGFYRLHALSPEVEANYDLWRSLVHPQNVTRVEAEIQEAIRTGDSFTSEYQVSRPGGDPEEKWISIGGRVVLNEHGEPVTMAGYCLDVTRRKQTEAALIQTEKLAVAGRLAASVAHEINNPLEAAVNLVFLAQSDAAPEQAAFLDEALAQLERVATIAQQTLQFSRKPGTTTTCAPAQIVDSVLVLLRPKLTVTATEVVREIRSERQIPCTPGEIQQVLTNIINNAIDAMGQNGRLRIRIADSTLWGESSTRGVRLTISDNGSGMLPEVLRRLKEPFFTTKSETGTGLGMWITNELVERHKGKLSVRTSAAGRHHGTVFSLFLPDRVSEEAEVSQGTGPLEILT